MSRITILQPIPKMLFKVYPVVLAYLYTVGSEKLRLLIYPAEDECLGEPSHAVNDAVARNSVGVGVCMQCITDYSRPTGIPREHRYLSVCRDLAAGYFSYLLIN